MYLDLNIVKKHLNVDDWFTSDDEYISGLIDVAEEIVSKHLDNKLDAIVSDNGSMPAPIMHACMLLIGNFYANRESIAFANATELPLGYSYLLQPYKNYSTSQI